MLKYNSLLVLDFEFCLVDFTQDLTGSDSLGHPCESLINEICKIASLGTVLWNNCLLGTRINKSLERMTIYLNIDIKHRDFHKILRHIFLSKLSILKLIYKCLSMLFWWINSSIFLWLSGFKGSYSKIALIQKDYYLL